MNPIWLLYPLIGVVAGLLAGLFGIGGGLVIVPALLWVYGLQGFAAEHLMHLAIGTSLATIVLTGASSVQAHYRRGAVDLYLVRWLVLGILVGAVAGSWLADRLATDHLKALFGAFEVLVGIKLWFELRPSGHADAPGRAVLVLAGGIIGTVSVLLGIGGGTLTVPLLVWFGVAMTTAVGTASACGVPIALAGAVGFVVIGQDAADLPARSLGYVYWPAALGIVLLSIPAARYGAALAHRLPARELRRLFALLLIGVGVRMFW